MLRHGTADRNKFHYIMWTLGMEDCQDLEKEPDSDGNRLL